MDEQTTIQELRERLAQLERLAQQRSSTAEAAERVGPGRTAPPPVESPHTAAVPAARAEPQAPPPPAAPPVPYAATPPQTVYERALAEFGYQQRMFEYECQQFGKGDPKEELRRLFSRSGRADYFALERSEPVKPEQVVAAPSWRRSEFGIWYLTNTQEYRVEVHGSGDAWWFTLTGPDLSKASTTFPAEHVAKNAAMQEYRRLQAESQKVVAEWIWDANRRAWLCELCGYTLSVFGEGDQFAFTIHGPGAHGGITSKTFASQGEACDAAAAEFKRLRGEVAA